MEKDNNKYFLDWYIKLSLDDKRLGVKQTAKEVAFIRKVLNLGHGSRLLDLCCGHGRHTIDLAKNLNVTGLDLDPAALRMLNHKAKLKGIKLSTLQSDMRRIPFTSQFDASLLMYSSFGYFSDDEQNLRVLRSINNALKPGGLLLFDVKNRFLTIKNSVELTWEERADCFILYKYHFDEKNDLAIMDLKILNKKTFKIQNTGFILKLYTPDQLTLMLQKTGFEVVKLFGSTTEIQPFNRKSSSRLVVLARKKGVR